MEGAQMSENIELADVVNAFGDEYSKRFGDVMLPSHKKALAAITGCMTERMGGHQYQCAECQKSFWVYHGCRNRSCPKCHGTQTAQWLQKRTAEILPCDYFHVIATVPGELRNLFLKHQEYLYGLLMKTVAGALCELAQHKRFIGAVPGILAVLHTWSSRLHSHPHVHLLVTGGGVSRDGTTWHEAPKNFLVPVKKLSQMINKRLAQTLEKERPDLYAQIPANVWKKEWCSYCKPFGTGQNAVLNYLARYVFRCAITNRRILHMDKTHVIFKYKDNNTGKWKTERIRGVDFIRRFLLHVLPKGFHKVRYYGLWSPGKRKLHKKATVMLLLAKAVQHDGTSLTVGDICEDALTMSENAPHPATIKCPECGSEKLYLLRELRRGGFPMIA